MLHAFVDESGDRGITLKSSPYFVMSAVVIADADLAKASDALAQIRSDLSRGRGDPISWKNIKTHQQRLRAVQIVAIAPVTLSSVVVCKRYLGGLPTDEHQYLYTFRFLLERLSWFARDRGKHLDYTLAMITRFKMPQLRDYEARLKDDAACNVAWTSVAKPGMIDQPNRREELQLADIAASATAAAFVPDRFGNVEHRYLAELAPRLYRRGVGSNALLSYGLKMHPWNQSAACQRDHAWVADL